MLQLCDLYENDCIFDKFDCAMSGRGDYVCTGSYSNFFKVTARTGGDGCLVEASRDPLRKRLQTPKVGAPGRSCCAVDSDGGMLAHQTACCVPKLMLDACCLHWRSQACTLP